MSAVIIVRPPHPHAGSYTDWQTYRAIRQAETRVTARTHRDPPPWRPCPTCWGQRELLEPVRRPNGEIVGYGREMCWTCIGIGSVPST